MFCPKCGTENDLDQGYCRQCGQSLDDVRLAIQRAPSESLVKLKSGARLMTGGIAFIAGFTLIGVILTLVSVLFGHPVLAAVAMLNALLGVLVGLPLVMVGKMRVHQAARLLSHNPETRALDVERRNEAITSAPQSDFTRLAPGSVTEHTTMDLRGRGKI